MFRSQAQCLLHRSSPYPVVQSGNPENQIYAQVQESGPADQVNSLNRPGCIVPAVHPLQQSVVKRLDTHAEPVHANLTQSFQVLGPACADVIGIDLHCKLFIPVSFIPENLLSDARSHIPEYIKRQHRWGAASYVERVRAAVQPY